VIISTVAYDISADLQIRLNVEKSRWKELLKSIAWLRSIGNVWWLSVVLYNRVILDKYRTSTDRVQTVLRVLVSISRMRLSYQSSADQSTHHLDVIVSIPLRSWTHVALQVPRKPVLGLSALETYRHAVFTNTDICALFSSHGKSTN